MSLSERANFREFPPTLLLGFSNLILPALILLVITLAVVSPLAVFAQESARTNLRVQLVGIDGSTQAQNLDSITADGTVQFENDQTLKLDQLQELRTELRLLGDDKTTTSVYLIGGGLLYARSVTIKDGILSVDTDLGDLKYPLLVVRGIRPPTVEGETEWLALLREPSREEDRLLVTTSRGPRVVAGLLEEYNSEGVRINFEDAERRVTADKILGLAPALLEGDLLPKYEIQVIDRSVLIADSIQYSSGKWTFGWKEHTVSFPDDLVCSIRIRSDRVFYVSELNPSIDEVQTILAPSRPSRRNASVIGTPLSLRIPVGQQQNKDSNAQRSEMGEIREFARGWGVRARNRLVFELPAGYDQVSGWVGIDTATAGHGVALASIFLDGIQVASYEVRGDGNATAIQVPLNGARRLELLVEPGAMLDLADWVDWADLRLIR